MVKIDTKSPKKPYGARPKNNKLIFYIVGISLPVLQFIIFYLYVNFNSIMLAFQKYDSESLKYVFAGFENFKQIFSDFAEFEYLRNAVINSLIAAVVSFSTMFVSLLFSYYIAKKGKGHKLFQTILYLPHVIMSVTLVMIFTYFTENVIREFADEGFRGLLFSNDLDVRFATLIFYSIWVGFGVQVLLFSGSMSAIDNGVIEAAQIDGVNAWQEFTKIIVPMIYPTFITFVLTTIAGIFVNQLALFSVYGPRAELQNYTIGYYLYKNTQMASLADYPYLSAFGLMITLVIIPISILVKKGLEKIGPTTE